MDKAEFSRRVFAWLIDLIVVSAFSAGFLYLFADINIPEGLSPSEIKALDPEQAFPNLKWTYFFVQAVGCAYLLCEVFFAKTLGKKLTNL